jgi:hypothetical protein
MSNDCDILTLLVTLLYKSFKILLSGLTTLLNLLLNHEKGIVITVVEAIKRPFLARRLILLVKLLLNSDYAIR